MTRGQGNPVSLPGTEPADTGQANPGQNQHGRH